MAFFPDLSACPYFTSVGCSNLLAVGWLDRRHTYTMGDHPGPEFRRRLAEFRLGAYSWQPSYFMGGYECDLCPDYPSRTTQREELTVYRNSVYNLFVPGLGVTYVAPENIGHYIYHHRYLPPAEFCAALIASPTVNSPEYFSLLQANGWAKERARLRS